jgi:major membrane immunogen (membrane-anchored lipoprotein)
MVEEGTSAAPDEFDAITGATRTSESFRNIVNRAVANSDTISRGQ